MRKKIVIVVLIVIIVMTIGFVIFVNGDTNNEVSKRNPTDKVITKSTDNPDENDIDKDTFVWNGKNSDPKYISFAGIKAEGFIQKVGVDQRNEIGVPTNINLAGWFSDSAVPGANGLSIIDGHVDGKTKPGIFVNLSKVKVGQKFTIEFGNGKKKQFTVTAKSTVSTQDAPSVLYSQEPDNKSQLNLITCGGTFDTKAKHYEDRIIVSAVPA